MCFAINGLYAQAEIPLAKTWSLGFAFIGAEAIGEFPIAPRSTFRVAAGGILSGSTVQVGQNDFDIVGFGVFSASASYRFYYKFKDINRKGKPLFYNSGNFFFGQLTGSLPAFNSRDDLILNSAATIGGGWGLQRMYQNKFVFSFGIGPGFRIPNSRFTVIGEMTLGIRLSPKENN